MEDFHILAAMLEDVPCKHGSHPVPQPVVQPHGRAVIHHPEPDQWLAFAVLHHVNVAIRLRFERAITRIERVHQSLLRQRSRRPWRRVGTSKVKLVQRIARNLAAMLWITIHELPVELVDPLEETLFRLRSRIQNAVFVSRHTFLSC